MIAIRPQIGSSSTTATPAVSQSHLSANDPVQPFSATLKQATSSSPDSSQTERYALHRADSGGHSSDGVDKRESKSQADSAGSKAPGTAVQIVAAQLAPPPPLPQEEDADKISRDDLKGTDTNDELTLSATAGKSQVSKADDSSRPIPLHSQGSSSQESSNLSNQEDSIARLLQDPSGAVAPDLKAAHGVTQSTHLDFNGAGISTDVDIPSQSTPLSSTDQLVSMTGVPPAVVPLPSVTGNIESTNLLGTSRKALSAESRPTTGRETLDATRKDSNGTGSTKVQSRKDDSSLSTDSAATAQSESGNSLKAAGAPPAFLVTSTAPSSTTGDGRGASVDSNRDSNEQQGALPGQELSDPALGHPADVGVAYPSPLINSAKLVERLGEAELRIGIRTEQFGNVDIRTSMVRNQFMAEITVERGDLGRVMAAELPILHNRLAEQRVAVGNLSIISNGDGHSGPSEGHKQKAGPQLNAMNNGNAGGDASVSALMAGEANTPALRLDIHM